MTSTWGSDSSSCTMSRSPKAAAAIRGVSPSASRGALRDAPSFQGHMIPYVYLSLSLSIYIYIYIHICIHIYHVHKTYICIYIYICVHVYAYIYIYTYIYIYIHIYISIYIYIYNVYTYIYIYTDTYNTYICIAPSFRSAFTTAACGPAMSGNDREELEVRGAAPESKAAKRAGQPEASRASSSAPCAVSS